MALTTIVGIKTSVCWLSLRVSNRGVHVAELTVDRQATKDTINVAPITAHKAMAASESKSCLKMSEGTGQPGVLIVAIHTERSKRRQMRIAMAPDTLVPKPSQIAPFYMARITGNAVVFTVERIGAKEVNLCRIGAPTGFGVTVVTVGTFGALVIVYMAVKTAVFKRLVVVGRVTFFAIQGQVLALEFKLAVAVVHKPQILPRQR